MQPTLRRFTLLCSMALPALVAAQDAGTPAAAPAQPAPVRPSQTNVPDTEALKAVAKVFFQALLAADARGASHSAATPFFLEGARLDTEDAVAQALINHLRSKRTDLLTLYGIDVYSPEEMVQKFGKPPARLSAVNTLERGTMYAVGNISGRAAIAQMKVIGGHWRVIAFHD